MGYKKFILDTLLFSLLLVSCSEKKTKNKEIKNSESLPKQVVLSEFQQFMDSANVQGSILFYDFSADSYFSNDFNWAKQGRLPASTFKIPNSIIALETGLAQNGSTVLKWDGKPRPMKIWEKDLTFRQAFHLSCVPCYQEIARKVGTEQMQHYTKKFNYGDLEITTENIDKFWLEGNSKISQFQQIDFLKEFYQGSLPISEHTTNIMKRMMVIEFSNDYILRGKTGWAIRGNENNGWFVGYIESGDNAYFFATNIEPKSSFEREWFLSSRKEVTMEAFRVLRSTKNKTSVFDESQTWQIETSHSLNSIDSLMLYHLKSKNIPGMALGIISKDSLVWSKGYGAMAIDNLEPVTGETLFRIASITKVFTAIAVMKLVEEGRIDLDDPLKKYLDWFDISLPNGIDINSITVRHLLTHTSGLPRDSKLTNFKKMFQPTREDALRVLSSQSLNSEPGTTYAYSNLGYALLGELISETSQTSYSTFLKQNILTPLNMNKTLVHPTIDSKTAWGHGPQKTNGIREKAGYWDLKFATPAGGMATSVKDLSQFVIEQLAPYTNRPTETQVLNSESLKEMHKVQFELDPERGGSGLSWGVETSNNDNWVYHGGELPEQTSYVLIDIKNQLGVILLTNAQSVNVSKIAEEIRLKLLESNLL